MSGNAAGGAGAGATIGAIAGGIGAAAFTGGLGTEAGAAIGAGIGGLTGAGLGASQDTARQQKTKLGQLVQPITTPRALPTIDSDAVRRSRANNLLQLRLRSGRGSTLLTNQQGNTFGG